MAQQTRQTAKPLKLQAPRQLTPFIGRQQELADLAPLLNNPTCRLLSLVGSGGVGKTRLAIQAAAQVADDFTHGVSFVPLQSVQSTDFLVPAMADALDVPLTGQAEPIVQLLHYLRNRELLLLLDNFEQLLGAGGRDVLLQILEAAPRVKLLVTSREVLNFQGEWLYPVAGLAAPAGTYIEGWAGYDAVKLLVERARRVRRDISLEREAEGIVHLCQLVEGMPLALELAATWTKTLTCAEVADEIQRSLDFLSTTLRDVPKRHRSMQAVFEQVWQRLTPEEEDVFRRLSVFRGGFRRAAVKAVAEATLPVLTTLVDKSLLRWEPDGRRYQTHELLRQFGEEQLAQLPEAFAYTHDLHAKYYTGFLGDRFDDLTGARQGAALAEIGAELGNIRAAWQWAVSRCFSADLEYAAMGLHTFYQYRGYFLEGVEVFAAAVSAVEGAPPSPERDRALAALLNCAGWFEMRFGRVQAATHMQEKALALYEAHNRLPAPGQGTDPLTALSLLAATRGDYEQATAFGQQAWQRAAARSDQKNMAFARFGLAGGALAQGNYETALQYAQETLALTEAVGNRWLMAYAYNHLGQIHQALGNLAAARDYYQASYTLKEELDDPEGMALALSYLGEIALAQSAYQQAHDLYRQSLKIYQKLGDRGGLVRALQGLGVAVHKLGNEPMARQYLQQALQVASEAQIVPLILSVLVGIGTYFVESSAPKQGIATLTFVQQHPASDQMMKDKVDQLLKAHQDVILTEAETCGAELDTLVPTLLAELSVSVALTEELSSPVYQPGRAPDQSLLDPLSDRELEVLRLISEGLTNRQIAERLFVVLGTVKAHSSNIYSKLGVSNRTQAVTRARELNLL
jgi:predicted ATPase/DNA-binding NarL/FixJ family response regulator